MSWRPLAWEWHPAAERELLQKVPHWKTAAEISAAVIRFAETGTGLVERVPNHPNRYRLRIVGYHVIMWIDVAAHELTVIGCFRAR